VELAADGDSPVCGKAPSGETGPTGAEGGAASVGELAVGASRGRAVPRAAPSGRPPPVAQLLTSPVPISSTATARATPRRPRPGPTHLPAATSAPVATAEPTEVVQTHRSPARRPSLPVAHRTSSTIRSGWAAGRAVQGDRASTRARRDEEVQEGQASTWTRLGVPAGRLQRVHRRLQSSRATSPSASGRAPPSGHLATPLPGSHARPPGSPAPSRRSCRQRRACRHLGLAQMVVIWASHSSNPASSTGQPATSRGRCGHGTSTCPCCLSPVHVRH